MPLELKGKFYRTTIIPSLQYELKCWAFRKDHSRKIEVAEMRILRLMSGHTLRDIIRDMKKV